MRGEIYKKCLMALLFLFFLSYGSIAGFAQNQDNDTLKVETLPEVMIQAQLQKTSAKSSVYTPTIRQKEVAQNAIDLLRQLAISQISINLMSNKVTTTTGEGVSLFINYIPASSEDIDGLLITDVRRVEYLDFPTDPRFQGREHVIHFIVHKYEYGGYTKLSVNENFLTGLSSNVSIFSKFAYKRMIYDLYVGGSNHNLHNIGTSTIGTYSLLDDNGGAKTIIRKELFNESHYKQNSYPFTFRAIYDSDKIQITNTVGFSYSEKPIATYSGILSYEPDLNRDYQFTRDNPTRQKQLTWNGYYFFALEKGYQLSLSPFAGYGRVNDNSWYTNTLPNSIEIENNAKEDQYRYGLNATLNKRLSDRHQLFFSGYYGANKSDVSYRGTSTYTNEFMSQYGGATIGYNFSNNRWSLNANSSLQWEENRINKKSVRELYPLFNISAGYSPSSQHSIRSFFHYGANYPGASVKTPNVLQEHEMMYFTGNPEMGLSRQFNFNLSYNWLPNNMFSASLYGQYYGEIDLYVPIFEHYNGGKAILRKYDTDAEYHRVQMGASFNYKMLDGKLHLAASPSVTIFRVLGYYDKSKSPFYFNASAKYYLKDFYFQAAYQTKFRTIQGNRAVYFEDRDFWQLQAGWSKNNLNIRLSANNLFRDDWRTSTETLDSPLYSEVRYLEGNNFHRRINLSMTYTFGYGKKIRRGNEVGQQYGGNSAILK